MSVNPNNPLNQLRRAPGQGGRRVLPAGYKPASRPPAVIKHGKPTGVEVPACYNRKDYLQGEETCGGSRSKSKYTDEAQRIAQKLNNLSHTACARANPNYVSRTGTRHGALSAEGLAEFQSALQSDANALGFQLQFPPCPYRPVPRASRPASKLDQLLGRPAAQRVAVSRVAGAVPMNIQSQYAGQKQPTQFGTIPQYY
jgi:hypothetical protein